MDNPQASASGSPRPLPGRQFGPYCVEELIGAGGMGEVYRARDTRLGRDVAVKLLPTAVAHDGDRRVRFEREARLLASVSHPHIAAIHGVEESDGQLALILELVEGPTLADRLRRGPLPPGDAIQIARELAEAIDAAHEKGIVHRDLKPANIKLAPGRGVKVLDFGLAKVFGEERPEDPSQEPTVTAPPTRDGAVLGTAAYMSPEQARGQPIDRRTDIWAFGCVLYEMLTGRLAFAGHTSSDTIVAVLDREPDWRALPDATPAHVRRLLRRCLEKDPRRRVRDIGDVASDLHGDRIDELVTSPGASSRRLSGWALALAAVGLVAAASAITAVVMRRDGAGGPAPYAIRFSVPPPAGANLGGAIPDVEVNYLALSPDGSQLAMVATGPKSPSRIWVRRLSTLVAEPVVGTDGATSLFWSPDGRSLGFFAGDTLKRIDHPGGTPVDVAVVPTGGGLSGSWGDGQILFAAIHGGEIFSVSLSGHNRPVSVVKADPDRQERRLYWPSFLPDGKRFLYLAGRPDGTSDVRLFEPGTPTRSLFAGASNVEWVEPDFLVFGRDGALLAQRVDLAAGRLTGEPFAIADGVNYSYIPARTMFTSSRNGVVVYQSHLDVARLARIDAAGREVETIGSSAGYQYVRTARDRNQLIFARINPRLGTADIWLLDRGREQKIISNPFPDVPGPWLPGRDAFVFSSGSPPHLFQRDLRTGSEQELIPGDAFQIASDVTPDGTRVLFSHRGANVKFDVSLLPLTPGARPSPLFSDPFTEVDARLSPDGRAVAFVSDQSEAVEVYVAAFPEPGSKTRISIGRGAAPRWSGDGRSLFYLSGLQLMEVPVRTTPELEIGTPRSIATLGAAWRDFDVSPGGGFVAIVSEKLSRQQPLTAVVNWPAEIRK